jgi:hypothetical protein
VRLVLARPLAADAIDVVGVEVGAMSAGIGDVVGEAGQPSNRLGCCRVAAVYLRGNRGSPEHMENEDKGLEEEY